MSVINITKENFEKEVLKSEKPVLLDFWASWCGPCRMVSPIIDEIADERSDIKVGKVNVDDQLELASAFQVMNIPTLLVIKDGQVANRMMGARPKSSDSRHAVKFQALEKKKSLYISHFARCMYRDMQ